MDIGFTVTAKDSVKILFYLMAVDGEISSDEVDTFDEMAKQVDIYYLNYRDELETEVRRVIRQTDSSEKLFEAFKTKTLKALSDSKNDIDAYYVSRTGNVVLVWNMLALSYSDSDYSENEKKLIQFVADKLSVPNNSLKEMETIISTVNAIDCEIAWLKNADRPYSVVEPLINELSDRRVVIMNSFKDLAEEIVTY